MALPFPQATIAGGCLYDPTDGPGGVGSRFIAPGEDMTTFNDNRPHWALVQNDEYLGDILTKRDLACREVGALAAFAGNNIKIDPSGGAAGNINYTGKLYLGEAGWPANQESLDNLFQLLDENYNEVMVDGVEVKVTSIQAPRAVGQGFVALITQLNLNKTIPSGNYRFAYGRGRTLETVPAYAFIGADIRGIHEAAGESQFRNIFVCAVTNSRGPADFVGADSLIDALTELQGLYGDEPFTIFLRSGGTYTAPATIADSNITILGDGDQSDGAVLSLPTGQDLTISGTNVHLGNVRVTKAVAGEDRKVVVTGERSKLIRASLSGVELRVSADYGMYSDLTVGGYNRGLYITTNKGRQCSFHDIVIDQGAVGATAPSLEVASGGGDGSGFSNISVVVGAAVAQPALRITKIRYGCSFDNCKFRSVGAAALEYEDDGHCIAAYFKSCEFSNSSATLIGPVVPNTEQICRIVFWDCLFQNGAATWYDGPFVALLASDAHYLMSAVEEYTGFGVYHCFFSDASCKGHDGDDPPGGASGLRTGILNFRNVDGEDITFDRRGINYDLQRAEWVRVERCNIRKLTVFYDCVLSIQNQGATFRDGLVEVKDGSLVEDLLVQGRMGRGCSTGPSVGWQSSVLYVEGGSSASSGRVWDSIVDGFRVVQVPVSGVWGTDVDEWFNIEAKGGLLAKIGSRGIVRRTEWTNRNKLSISTGLNEPTYCLVYLNDSDSTMDGGSLELGNGTTYGGLLRNFVVSGADAWRTKVRNVFFKADDYDTAACLISHFYYVDANAVGDQAEGGMLEDCHFHAVGDNNGKIPIYIDEYGKYWRVHNNHVHVTAPTEARFIYFEDGDYRNALGGGGIAVGNVLESGNATVPDIRSSSAPSYVAGHDQNVFAHS